MDKKNVLLIYTDQQRWDTLRCGGNQHVHTPNLDSLAADGALFQNAFCNNPVCMPSRMSMLSGQYPSSLGVSCNGIEMPEDVPTLASILGQQGYHTANIGKLHFTNHSNRDHQAPHPSYGFQTLLLSDEPGCYDDAYINWVKEQEPNAVQDCRCDTPPAWKGTPVEVHPRNTHEPYLFDGPEHLTHSAFVAAETEKIIRAQTDRPFFAVAGFYAPHPPLNPPKRFVEMYNPETLPLPIMNEGENVLGLSDKQWQEVKAYYYALVTHVDEEVGKLLKALDDTGARENTIIVFTSDHGEHLGDHGQIQKGPPGYDSCIHVPLIISAPEQAQQGLKADELVEAVDLAPTILELCGVEIPTELQGRSLAPLLQGKKYDKRSSVFVEYHEPSQASWKTVRTHEYKLCVSNVGEELLFDLVNDPQELHNKAEDKEYRTVLNTLREELLARWFSIEKQHPLRTGEY